MCYTYDNLSRVTARTVKKLSDNSVVSTETFNYDADGIRTKKNGITFTYVDGKLIRQTGGSGTIDFIYGAGGAIGFKFAGNTYIYRRNLMGDATHIYTTDGTLVARYTYDAWGNHRIYDINGNEVTKGISRHDRDDGGDKGVICDIQA